MVSYRNTPANAKEDMYFI